MSDEIVVLRQFGNEAEANLAASVLEANGIPARVVTDTAGGAFPSLALVFPIRLLVRRDDRSLALQLLDEPLEEPLDEPDPDSAP
jgi:hypothetical protein